MMMPSDHRHSLVLLWLRHRLVYCPRSIFILFIFIFILKQLRVWAYLNPYLSVTDLTVVAFFSLRPRTRRSLSMRLVVLLWEAMTKTRSSARLEDDDELNEAIVVSARKSIFPQAVLYYFDRRSATAVAKLPESTRISYCSTVSLSQNIFFCRRRQRRQRQTCTFTDALGLVEPIREPGE
ncbi:hypothetical protein B0H11DRAFT_722739 [Mycena galericulata]|nr:hypothetical protein B0H11DRAFT_722739 [Mycena galericulata]